MQDRPQQQRFEAYVREHQRIVFKVASIYASHAEDRRDLAQEIYVQAWRSFGRYDAAVGKFSTWLYRVALNVAISQVRRQRPVHASRFESLEPHHADQCMVSDPLSEENERVAQLYAHIAKLDLLHRALMLLYLDDRSHAEMAEILGISQTNVATKIGRIKQILRNQMAGGKTAGV